MLGLKHKIYDTPMASALGTRLLFHARPRAAHPAPELK
jgi:hypothetical protein